MGEADRGGSGGREDSGKGERGADGLHLLSKVGGRDSDSQEGGGEDRARLEERGQRSLRRTRGRIAGSRRLPWWTEKRIVQEMVEKREQMRRRGRERFQVMTGGDNMRSRGKGGGGLQGARESNKVMVRHGRGVTERAKVQQDLVKTRSNWFPALWVGGGGGVGGMLGQMW